MSKYEMTSITSNDKDAGLRQQIADIEVKVQQDPWRLIELSDSLQQPFNHCIAVVISTADLLNNKSLYKPSEQQLVDPSLVVKQVIAYCLYSHVFEVAEILRIGTHPNYRRQGLASQLINQLKKIVVDRDVEGNSAEQVLLEVRADNVAAIALYEKMGFHTIYRRKDYYKESSNTLIANTAAIDKNKSSDKKAAIINIGNSCDALIMQTLL